MSITIGVNFFTVATHMKKVFWVHVFIILFTLGAAELRQCESVELAAE